MTLANRYSIPESRSRRDGRVYVLVSCERLVLLARRQRELSSSIDVLSQYLSNISELYHILWMCVPLFSSPCNSPRVRVDVVVTLHRTVNIRPLGRNTPLYTPDVLRRIAGLIAYRLVLFMREFALRGTFWRPPKCVTGERDVQLSRGRLWALNVDINVKTGCKFSIERNNVSAFIVRRFDFSNAAYTCNYQGRGLVRSFSPFTTSILWRHLGHCLLKVDTLLQP